MRNNPVPLGEDPVVHNSYLHVLAETGLLGLVGFVGFLASSWRLLARGRRRAIGIGDRDGQRLATAMQASLIVAVVAGAFLSEQFTTPFWMIGALATVVAGVPQAVRVTGPQRRAAGRGGRRRMKVGLVTTLARGGPVEHARASPPARRARRRRAAVCATEASRRGSRPRRARAR